uniref:Ig-like domain-containing protein n=1 Tax=Felis catus TaxID=9685 RepID=A0ABI7YRM3_FELCA
MSFLRACDMTLQGRLACFTRESRFPRRFHQRIKKLEEQPSQLWVYSQMKPSTASPQAMPSASYLGLSLLLILRGINGDSVTQTEGSVTLFEGTPLTLNCTYQSSYTVFVFWYVQYQNKAPQLLLKSLSENQRAEHHGFHASLVKSDGSFHLQKRSVRMSDSAVYYCVLGGTVRSPAGGAEHKPRGGQEGPGCEQPGRGE